MKLTRVTITDTNFAFHDGVYVMSHVTQDRLRTRVLEIESDDGATGLGEVARMPVVDAEIARGLEDACLSTLGDRPDMATLPAMARIWRERDTRLYGLCFALETAHADWLARRAGLPLHAVLGGRRCEAVPDYLSLSAGTADAMRADLAAHDRGNPVLQIKLGVGAPSDDIDRTTAVLDALDATAAPNRIVLADFNGGRAITDALTVLRAVRDPRVVWEEPCADYADARAVMAACDAPVQLDQCLLTLAEIGHAVGDGAAHSIAIKPAKLGGLTPAMAARDLCADADMTMRVDGPWCGPIAATTVVHLALTAPPDLIMSSCDLRQPLIHDPNQGGITHLPGGRLSVEDEAGHGAMRSR